MGNGSGAQNLTTNVVKRNGAGLLIGLFRPLVQKTNTNNRPGQF